MPVLRSLALFLVTALFEIGGAWLVRQGVREHRGRAWIALGALTLAGYGFRPDRGRRRPARPGAK